MTWIWMAMWLAKQPVMIRAESISGSVLGGLPLEGSGVAAKILGNVNRTTANIPADPNEKAWCVAGDRKLVEGEPGFGECLVVALREAWRPLWYLPQ